MAKTMGMEPGFAIDLTLLNGDGGPWDSTCAGKRKRAEAKIIVEGPPMLVTSPMCAKFSTLQALFDYCKKTKKVVTMEKPEQRENRDDIWKGHRKKNVNRNRMPEKRER